MLEKSLKLSRPGPVRQKVFKPKNNLPRLADYSVDPLQSYWDSWNKVTFSDIKYSSWLNASEFVNVALEARYSDMNHVNYIHDYLVHGAKIGCEGEGRLPTQGPNDPSVSDHVCE